jgi:hypothetical protein
VPFGIAVREMRLIATPGPRRIGHAAAALTVRIDDARTEVELVASFGNPLNSLK